MSCTTGFKFSDCGFVDIDFDDVFVRKEIFSEGGLWMWGVGAFGRLGTNSTSLTSSPVQTVSGGTNWKQVSLGEQHSAAIKTDGTLWLWGSGANGRLGDNSIINRSSPVQTVSGGTNWKQVSAKSCSGTAAAIKTDGTLWVWGYGNSGTLGTNNIIDRSSPVQTVSGGTNWKQVGVGGYNMAAIKTDGTLWLWGAGGRIGDNANVSRSSPVQTVSGGTNWKQVNLSDGHSAAIKTDGTLWLWGFGAAGKLGDGTVISRSSPVQTVSGGNNWYQVSAGNQHSAAIKTDGTLWMWGAGSFGRLGTNNIIDRSSPVQTVSGGTNWKQVSVSLLNGTAAIKTDGTLWSWGWNLRGEVGDNSIISRSSPVQTVSGGTNWKQVSAGSLYTAAIREDCW
jgi:alpha-tubulin suppressor-like RCC1 family protein